MALFARRGILRSVAREFFNPGIRAKSDNCKERIVSEVSSVFPSKVDLFLNFTHEDWQKTRNDLLENCPSVNERNVDNVILDLCFEGSRNIDFVKAYYDFLRARNIEMHRAVAKRFGRIFTNDQVKSLCQTEKWETAKSEVDQDPKGWAIWFWIAAAFRNGKHTIAWEYLKKAMGVHKMITTDIQKVYLKSCKEIYKDESVRVMAFAKMLRYLRDHSVSPFLEAAEVYKEAFEEAGWDVEHAEMRNRLCSNCGTKLKLPYITRNDCEILLQHLKATIVNRESFDAKRFRKFEKFVSITGPYDFVIDVLNVLPNKKISELKFLIDHLASYGRKVFFIAQSDLKKQNKILSFNNENIHCFHMKNKDDDSFLMYAALWSGPKTRMISLDLLRDHNTVNLEKNISQLFTKWQVISQLKVASLNRKNNKVTLERLIPFESTVQEDENGWHMPYLAYSAHNAPYFFTPRSTWLCFRKPTFKEPNKLR